jgi:biopolymer transport protein ExbD
MRRHKRGDDEAEINMTPMLDIVFIMLIFFIVTTSFVKEIGIDVNRPSNAPPRKTKESQVILIEISEVGVISINRRQTEMAAVRANIESERSRTPDASVVVVADKDADSGILVRVIDQARRGGATRVSLATDAGS